MLRQDRTIKEDGSATIGLGQGEINFEDAQELLSLAFSFKPDVDFHHRQQIVTKAFFEIAREPDEAKIDADFVEKQIGEAEKKFRSIRRRKFFLLTQVSLDSRTSFPKRVRLNGATICFSRRRPAEVGPTDKVERTVELLGIGEHVTGWMYAKVFVEGRDAIEAGTRAMKELNLLRAMWNFSALRGQTSRSCYPCEPPLSVFRLAPLQTVYAAERKAAPSTTYWYQQPYLAIDYPGKAWNPGEKLLRLVRAEEKKIRSSLRLSAQQEFLSAQFQMYVSACDIAPHDERFMALWTVLEHLTGCGEGGSMNYGILVKRAASVFKDRKAYELILSSLRLVRNSVAHEMRSDFEAHSANKLFWIVNQVLAYHLSVSKTIGSKHDAFAFLDLPNDPEMIRREIKLREKKMLWLT